MKKYAVAGFLALLMLVVHARAASAQSSDTTRTHAELKTVKVEGKRLAKPADITLESSALPAKVTVVTHDELDRTNVSRDIGTMLRHVPGIMSHNLGQGDIGNSIKMRGFATSTHGADVAVYVDGAPQNVPSAAIAHGMNDMSWLTPDMIERVEVIKGPVSALYGDQSRAGSINIITRRSAQSAFTTSFASYGSRRASLVGSQAHGAFTSLLVADVNDANGYRVHSDGSRGSLFIKESYVQESSLWSLRGTFYKSDWNAPGFLNLQALQQGTIQPESRDTTTPPLYGKARRASVVFTRVPAGGDRGIHATAYYEHYERTRALGANLNDLNVSTDDRHILGGRVFENLAITSRAQIAFGGEIRTDMGDAINRRYTAGVPSGNYTFNQDLDLQDAGVYVQGQYKPFDMLKLLAGARYDKFAYEITNRKLPAASVRYRKGVGTPHLGLVFSPVKVIEVFANRGVSFRSPNQTEISPSGTLGALGASGGAAIPSLKPPIVVSVDAGVNLYFSERVTVSGVRYHTKNESEITLVSPGVYESVGNTLRDGFEADTRIGVTNDLDFYASYGEILQARIKSAAAGAADRLTVPRQTLKGGLAYTKGVGKGRLLLNADASDISGLPYFSGTPLKLSYTKAYARYDVRATYDFERVGITAFATAQPTDFSTEVATSATAGALIDPRPPQEFGMQFRYRFSTRSR